MNNNYAQARQKYNTARSNLALMLAFTVVNIVLFLAGADVMMLFSATIPYYAVIIGVLFEIPAVLIFFAAVAVVTLVLYLVCWVQSKRHYGWMIVALVLFSLDTLALIGISLLLGDVSGILDFLIHIWVLYYLIVGVRTGAMLKNAPEEAPAEEPAVAAAAWDDPSVPPADSRPLRRADTEKRARVLAQCERNGRTVCYRRVGRVNELVIDGSVYDETEMLMETPHLLSASLGGHTYEAGLAAGSRSFIRIDGETVVKKLRLF